MFERGHGVGRETVRILVVGTVFFLELRIHTDDPANNSQQHVSFSTLAVAATV